MTISRSAKLVLPTAIALATVGLLSNSSGANRNVTNGAKLMAQNLDNDSKRSEIRLPDKVQRQVEDMEREAQRKALQEREEASAREMSRKTPKEREEMEKEVQTVRDAKYAPERRTEEELKREDERAIKILNELKAKRQRE